MKILFVAKELRMEPLGIMYLIDALKRAGHGAKLERCDLDIKAGYDEFKSVRCEVSEWQPDFVAYSVCSGLESFYFELDSYLRQYAKKPFRSIFGGPSVTFSPERFPDHAIKVRGEGEVAIVDAVEGRPHKDLRLVDIEHAPIPERDEIYRYGDLRNNPIKNVISRRGCKYACAHCYEREWTRLHREQLPKGIVRYRDIDSVLDECQELSMNWPVEMINFVDDNFASSLPWLESFAPEFKKRVGLPFFCSVRPENATEDVVRLIAEAGGRNVNMAIEAANDHNRRVILTRTGSRDDVRKAIELVHKYGMVTRLQNMIGLPVPNSLADAIETLDFNCEVRPTTSWCAILQAYKGTKVYEIAKQGGYTPEDGATDESFFGISTLKLRGRRKIERLHKLWPVMTQYPWLRPFLWLLIRLPLPFSWFRWFHRWSKKKLSEKEYWAVCRGR